MNQPSRQERRREEFLRRKQAFRKAARALRERQAAQGLEPRQKATIGNGICEWKTVEEEKQARQETDRKSTRLNSSHGYISYAVFCLKKKKIHTYCQRSCSAPEQRQPSSRTTSAALNLRMPDAPALVSYQGITTHLEPSNLRPHNSTI